MNPYEDSFISPYALVDPSATIGSGTKIWQFSTIMAGVIIGENVSIGSGCEIGRGSRIGSGTRIGHGCFMPSNSVVGRNVFIGPSVTFTDDRFPVVNNPGYHAQPPSVEDASSIGAGSVILPGVRICHGARIGAGSVVTRDVPSNSLVYGEKALPRIQT